MSDASLSLRCILAVGNTGLGKSFTATVFGAQNVTVGHGSESQTAEVDIHNINGGFYIDTPGFNDSDYLNEIKSDEEIKRKIFRKMLEKRIENVTTILWFVKPDIRAEAQYKRQARFIESLADGYNGNVWDNTIIVTKGDNDAPIGGPRNAGIEIAQEKHNIDNRLLGTRDFRIMLFESLSRNSIYRRSNLTSNELNNEYCIFKGMELERILTKYESLMEGHLDNPVALKIRYLKCSKCSEVNDPRLASNKCHQETKLIHSDTEWRHLGKVEDRHPLSTYWKHTSNFYNFTAKEDHCSKPTHGLCAGVIIDGFGYWKCCKKWDSNAVGCKQFYQCCDKDYGSHGCQIIFNQCRHDYAERACVRFCRRCEKDSDKEKGCMKICKVCDKDPYNTEGCSEVGHNNVNHDFHELPSFAPWFRLFRFFQ